MDQPVVNEEIGKHKHTVKWTFVSGFNPAVSTPATKGPGLPVKPSM